MNYSLKIIILKMIINKKLNSLIINYNNKYLKKIKKILIILKIHMIIISRIFNFKKS